MFTKKEINHLVISVFILGFAFGFNDNQTFFSLKNWTINFIRALISAAIILLVYEISHKVSAKRYCAETEYEIWAIKRYGFWRSAKFPVKILNFTISSFPLGIVLSVIATLLSNGLFYLTPISSFKIIEKPHLRIGAKFKGLTYFEEAKISSFSIIILIILALMLNTISPNIIFNQLTLMIFVFIGYNLLPISTLDGSKIFFGSVPLYISMVVFTLLSYVLMGMFNVIAALILAAVLSLFMLFLYFGFKKS